MESTAVGDVRNLIIVGSGPAGYTAAVYAARAQLNPLVFEGSVTAGGALMNTTDVENYPGFADGIMGPQLMEEMRKQAERFGAELVTDDVTAVDLNGDIKTVTDGSGNTHSAHAVVLAMGSGYRELGLENEKRLSGRGVSWCATCDGFFYRGKKVVVIGGGVADEHAAANALGLGAQVTVIDISLPALRRIEARFGTQVQTRASTRYEIAEQLRDADLVIGSVLIPGAAAPKLVTDDMVAAMKPGSVLVDIAIDQGGCFEGSRPTTHDDPTFPVHDSVYYCVANMPGAVPHTSTRALANATLPYVIAIADKGWDAASAADPALAKGLNVVGGEVVNAGVKAALGL